jgi:hypothetical protein
LRSVGCIASELTAMLARSSPTGNQSPPAFSVFQMPPETPPLYMTRGSAGSMTSTRVRPPMLPGPRNFHFPKGRGDSSTTRSSSVE